MPAFNIVRCRVKPGREQDFIATHREMLDNDLPGMQRFVLVDTGNGNYTILGEWESFDHIVAARPQMIGMLDLFRDMLDDLGNGTGITDPVSGKAVFMAEGTATKRAKRGKKKSAKKKAAKPAAKKKAPAKKAAKKSAKKAPAKKRGRR